MYKLTWWLPQSENDALSKRIRSLSKCHRSTAFLLSVKNRICLPARSSPHVKIAAVMAKSSLKPITYPLHCCGQGIANQCVLKYAPNPTIRAETFAGRNFRDFCDFGPFSRKLMPGKKLNEKFAKNIFAKNKLFQKPRKFFQSLKNKK